jgi:hypothetical protein
MLDKATPTGVDSQVPETLNPKHALTCVSKPKTLNLRSPVSLRPNAA